MNFKCFLSLNLVFYIFLFISETSFGKECSFDKINCISCTEYQNCSGGLPQGRVISCDIGDNCTDDQLKQCRMKLNCYAQNECTQAGIFPDALVDSNYYVCLNDANSGFLKYEFTCPEGNFFDKASLTCVSRDVTGAATEDPVSSSVTTSTSSLPTSVDPSSSTSVDPTSPPTSIDPSSSTSLDPSDPTSTDLSSSTSVDPTAPPISTDPASTVTSSTSSTSISPTPPSTPTSSPTPSPTSAPFACIASGIFPNPDNCKMYYRCSTSLKAFFYICPGNSYFNEIILKCSMIITPSCQEQILKNSTTTLPSTTPLTTTTPATTPTTSSTSTTTTTPTTSSTSTTTTTTPPPTTPATTSTTTTTTQFPFTTTTAPSQPTPFSCPMTGIFENPSDCKSYYRCASSGQIFQYVCPGNTYFNEFTKRCSLLITPRCKKLIQG